MSSMITRILLGCVAVLAVSALAAGSASALLFLTANAKELFTIKSEKGLAIETTSGTKLACQAVLAHGFLLNKTDLADEVVLVLHKCESNLVSGACTSTKPASGSSGLIQTNPLMGLLVMVKGKSSTYGIVFYPESGGLTGVDTEFECASGLATIKATGGVVGEIQNATTSSTEHTVVFKKSAAGVQELKAYETLSGTGEVHLTLEIKSPLGTKTEETSIEGEGAVVTASVGKMCGS